MDEHRFDIKPEDIKDTTGIGQKIDEYYNRSKAQMNVRTNAFKLFTRLAHNQSLYTTNRNTLYSEGTTQALKRKIRAQTLQRVPDGEITTQFDKNSIEQVETEFIFDSKVLTSEYDGKDMLKNLARVQHVVRLRLRLRSHGIREGPRRRRPHLLEGDPLE